MPYSDNPVADFDQWDAERNRRQQEHRIGRCAQCGEDIHDYDDYYDFDGTIVHDHCVLDYIAQFKK